MGEEEDAHATMLRRYVVGGLSGCKFAPALAGKGKLDGKLIVASGPNLDAHDPAVLMDASLEVATLLGKAAMFVFPKLQTSSDIALFLARLQQGERWECTEIQWRSDDGSHDGRMLVEVAWQTGDPTLKSRVMGFAPLTTMPSTRRSPLVALALWPGGRCNPHHAPRGNYVSFADMPHGLELEDHQKKWIASEEETDRFLLGVPKPPRLRRIAFCLEESARALLFPMRAT